MLLDWRRSDLILYSRQYDFQTLHRQYFPTPSFTGRQTYKNAPLTIWDNMVLSNIMAKTNQSVYSS